jgi:hypothetical protein
MEKGALVCILGRKKQASSIPVASNLLHACRATHCLEQDGINDVVAQTLDRN